MNAPVPPIWTTGTTEVFKTGTWRAALPQHIHAPSPCHAVCPVNGDIAEWIGRARSRDYRGAWEILTHHNPFPAIAGRICHHPCEAACNRASYDDPLAICRLERFVGDHALERGWSFDAPKVERPQRIAVVGGGPSGLSAAFQLRRRGYRVALFESQPRLGGLMRYGIPSYRLARSVLDGEIGRIAALGIELHCGQAVGTAEDFAKLRAGYDAVYVAVGAQRQKRLPQLDPTRPWVMDGARYLALSNAGSQPPLGRRVVVVGGGSAALDVARSARRAGHDVTVLALEDAAQMPAQREEVAEALEEGIAFVHGARLVQALETIGNGLHLTCERVRFEPGLQRGRFTVTPLAGSTFTLEADAIVPSIGQDPDLAPFAETLRTDGALLAADARQATSAERVFAGGDVASLARFVTEAVGMGKRAAQVIDRQLRGMPLPDEDAAEAIVAPGSIATFYYAKQARAPERRLDPTARLADGVEVQLGLDAAQALAEAQRCFSCGTCILCDNCVHYCPDLAVRRTDSGDGYVVLSDYCKGCGVCVKECPTGSMVMREEAR
jgi:NADPH-dependent glutamate synthase beta subunit-like oxidoreductase